MSRNSSCAAILTHLAEVEAERSERMADPALRERVVALKRYQQRRFELTYADLLVHPRYAGASRFFLDELYGPSDFTQRDAQFARIVPGLVRLFPQEVVATVWALAALHALSERFDSRMARQLDRDQVDAQAYVKAWQACGEPENRERQIQLMEQVGYALDAFTRNALLRHSLRAMRVPARAAGLSSLQSFLESGFDTFRAMRGASEFLSMVGSRERALASLLFSRSATGEQWLGQLP
jgi:hypothetical protein